MEYGRPLYFCRVVSSFFLSSSSVFSSPILSHCRLDHVYRTSHTWRGLSANLRCRSETCCMRLAENTRRKKSPSVCHRTTLSGYTFATKACIDNPKKNLLNSNISPTSSQHGELWPTSGWDRFVSLGYPSEFQRVSRLGFVTAVTSLNGKSTKLCTMFGRLLAWYAIYTLSGSLAP